MSASLKTISGGLPPSLRTSFLRLLLLACSCTLKPAPIEPVRLILAICMCEENRAPVEAPPETIWTTPGGKPASAKSWPKARIPNGAVSDGVKINYNLVSRHAFPIAPEITYGVSSCYCRSNFPSCI